MKRSSISSIKAMAITPFVAPGEFRQNAARTIDAILSAEKSGADIIVLPKNSLSGDTADLRFLPAIATATLTSALEMLSKTQACVVLGIAFLGADVALISAGGRVRSAVLLRGDRKAFALLKTELAERGHKLLGRKGGTDRSGGFLFKGVYVSVVDDSILSEDIFDWSSRDFDNSNYEFGKTDRLSGMSSSIKGRNVDDSKADSIYVKDSFRTSTGEARFLAIPAAYPALLGGTAQKISEAAELSARFGCTVALSCSGAGESVSRYVRAGDKIIASGGNILAFSGFDEETAGATITSSLAFNNERETNSPINMADKNANRIISSGNLANGKNLPTNYAQVRVAKADYTPRYLPTKDECGEVWNILSRGIVARMREAHTENVILGLSGGLDSTCALIAAANAKKYGLPRQNIICVTMPSEISSEKTKANARRLVDLLGVSHLDIPIGTAVKAHLKDINHDKMDVVFENAQARERAQILLNLANKHNALVLGTSDLSEMALGFSTYGGDQLAHYNPNCSLTKSAIRLLIGTLAGSLAPEDDELRRVLEDILGTPISPELLPEQETEKILGDYALHEYFLLRLIAYKECGNAVVQGALKSIPDYSLEYIERVYDIFIRRFFSARFKTNFACDGVMLTRFDLSNVRLSSDFSPEIFRLD